MSTGAWDPRLTEARNPRTTSIDRADSETIVRLIQAEDRAVPAAVAAQAKVVARVVEGVAARFRRGGRLIYAGAGTSGRLGTLDAAECPPTFGVSPSRVRAVIAGGPRSLTESSEGDEDAPAGGRAAMADLGVGPEDFVLGIATSGTTPWVHGALVEAAKREAGTGLLCCSEPPPEIAGLVDHLIVAMVGPEVIAGSTRMKAGTATKLILNTITTGAMIRSGRVYENLMVDLRARSEKLVDRGIRIVAAVTGLDRREARALLVRSGGGVKTALAMQLLDADRAMAERYLDMADGFLATAVERWSRSRRTVYGGYPEAPGWPDAQELARRLDQAPLRLSAARAEGRAIDERGTRIRPRPNAWTPAQHVEHMLDFERAAVRPRVEAWVGAASGTDAPAFDDWEPMSDPTGAAGFEPVLDSFTVERAATIGAVRAGGETCLAHRARIGGEHLTLYQFLRGIAQHDQAHALRIEERVHPALLRSDSR